MDMTGTVADIHMRTDAKNLVTTAQTTHLPQQKETIHMIQMLRHEAVSGSMNDLAHVVSKDMLADVLTKQECNEGLRALKQAVESGWLPNADAQVNFRDLIKASHKALSRMRPQASDPRRAALSVNAAKTATTTPPWNLGKKLGY